ncbi:MAG TPA: endonuclease/exonuclease/phosphatase family protein [Pirellulales bacterium]|nr:endonuclease/exonuclease/phosphatase family protein [Pirellulales bacterium]
MDRATAPSHLPKLRCRSAFLARAAWAYLALVLAVALLLDLAGDLSWPATLIAFGPRWLALVPLAPLAAGAITHCRRAIVPLLLAACCVLGPLMGFCLPWRRLTAAATQGALPLRVVTFNVGDVKDFSGLIGFLKDAAPDVIALQECPYPAPLRAAFPHGWFTARYDELFVASRYPIVSTSIGPAATGQKAAPAFRCDIETPSGIVHIYCLHLYTIRSGLNRVRDEWWRGAAELKRVSGIRNEESRLATDFAAGSEPSFVVGDFNLTSESAVFGRDWGDWQDAFSVAGFGLGYTFAAGPIGLRIDHLLADRRHSCVRSCCVGPDFNGEHRPLVAELLLLNDS